MPVSVRSAFYRSRLPQPTRGGPTHTGLTHAIAVLALTVGIAACSSKKTEDSGTIAWSQPGSSSTVAPSGSTVPSGPPLGWQTALSGDTVTVELRDSSDYYRVARVELVGPNGITVAASEIDRDTNRYSGDYGGSYGGGPSVGLGVGSWSGGRRSSTGVGLGLGFPLGGSSSYEPPPPPVATITRARIRIPDPAFYRQTAASWVIRVTTMDRGNQSNVAVIPAPKPAS